MSSYRSVASHRQELDAINEKIQQHKNEIKRLEALKRPNEEFLVQYMRANKLTEYGPYKLDKLSHASSVRVTVTRRDKQHIATQVFEELGVNDPDALFKKIQEREKQLRETKRNAAPSS